MKILNKTINISLVFVFVFLFVPQFESQRGDELTPYQEYLIELKEYRRNCRNALKPFSPEIMNVPVTPSQIVAAVRAGITPKAAE